MNNLSKNILSPTVSMKYVDIVLLIVRLAAGFFMLTHGLGKLEALLGGDIIQFPDPLGVGATASLALAVFAELVCSILLIIGLGTRLAAIPLLVTMLVAVFIVHMNDGFSKQELGLLYTILYVIILVLGPGKYSLDQVLFNKNQ